MSMFTTKKLPDSPDVVATDGSDVRVLLRLSGGSMAHFELAAGATSIPVVLPALDEIWFFLTGRGQMWRSLDGHEETVDVEPGICLTIPRGTQFQFRSLGDGALAAVGVTMPPWPFGDATAARVVDGPWEATLA